MPLLGWDASHYDGPLTKAILARAKSEGVAFFTHKIGEGLADTEGTMDDTALAAARDAGIELIGGYLVPRSNVTVATQVARWLFLADAGEPWWRTFPGWFWQIDLERWSYDNVPASVGIACAREIRRRTGRWTILYASHGQYGDELAGWDGPIWNADYVSRLAGSITAMYPGDDWQPLHGTWRGGWAPYSGKAPTILQYTSSATIAGLTTCDGNAFRGTLDQLRALITGGKTMAFLDDKHAANLAFRMDGIAHMADVARGGPLEGEQLEVVQAIKRIDTNAAKAAAAPAAMSEEQFADLKASVLAQVPTAADVAAALVEQFKPAQG